MRSSRCWIIAALAGSAVSSAALGQLVVGNDASTGQLWVVDLVTPANTRSLGSGTDFQVNALTADNSAGILYWIDGTNRFMRAPMAISGTLTPVEIGTTNIGGTNASITGFAWDSTDNMLVGYKNNATGGPEGFYSVDVSNGSCTLLYAVALSTDDFGGIDFDPGTNAFYGGNDSTTAANRGLYRIEKPWSSPTITLLAPYPGTDTDVDGCAVGGGRVYLVNDTAAQGAYVWNIAGGAYETTITPLPYTTSGIFAGGAWAPGLLQPLEGADVSLSVTDSPDPVVVPPGSNITYSVTVTNTGPEMATGVTFTDVLPGNTTFVSVGPPGIHNNGTITANIGDLAVGAQSTFDIVVSPNGLGTVTNIAGISTTSNDANPANNSATTTTTVRAPLADLNAAITPPGDCSVPLGGTATYLFTLNNTGPEAAEGAMLVVTFPSNVTFLSSFPPVTPSGDTLTLDLGTVSNGGGGSLSVDFRIDSGQSVVMGAAASSATDDPNSGNNSAGNLLNVPAETPTTASITAMFSTIETSDSSLVPNLGGARFSSVGGIQRPFGSANGQYFAVVADTDLATTTDQVLLVGIPNGAFGVAVQEGVTTTPDGGDLVGIIDEVVGINDSGDYAFATNTDLTTNDEVVIKSSGETLVAVARENQPGPSGYLFGATSDGVSLQNDGTASFYTSLVNATTATDTAWVTDDNVILVQEGTTIPTGQANGTTHPIGLLQTGGTEGVGLSLNASGTSYCGVGDLTVLPSTESRVLLVNNDVKIQEGHVIAGTSYTSPVNSGSPLTNVMTSNGDWLSYGSNADGQDWVLRNGVVIAETGGEITPGSGLTWGATFYAQTWFMAAGNGQGDYAVGGVFEGPTISNACIVLNGTTIVARENDPVDLDNNGQFDDGYYIRTFIDDRIFMTNDAIYCVVRLRDAAAAVCPGTDTDRGQALIRIPLGGGDTCPPCAADFNQDGGVDGSDVEAFFTAWESGESCGDVNEDGGVDGSDVEAFFIVWENGGC